jgi:hypothetical protein
MTWTIYNNDKAWGFLSADERRAFRDCEGDVQAFDFAAHSWADNYQGEISGGSVLRAAPEPTPAVDADQTAQLDTANARIAELEAEIVTARADALRDVQRIRADRDQGMLDYCTLMERYDAAIQNQTTEETPCSLRS